MNWTDIRPALKTLIESLSGLVTVWEDEPRPFTPPDAQAICLLQTIGIGGQGRDECRTIQDLTQPKGQEMSDEWRGNRRFRLTVKVESLIQTDAGFAYEYLERVRDKLPRESTRRSLHAVNCAVEQIEQTQDLTGALDDRNRSIAALDIMMAARNVVLDDERYPYIESADIIGTLQ